MTTPSAPSLRPRVVIIGCGFGGLEAARALRGAAVDVTLVDKTNHHLFQPLLYQVATAGLSAPAIAAPIRHLFRQQRNVTTLLGEVTHIDVGQRTVHLADGPTLPYDHLIVAAGATHSYFGRDDWAAYAPGLKTLDDAFEIRRRVLLAFEAAEKEPDPARRADWLNFVVVGAGPTGVEMAGTLAEIARHTLPGEFRHIDPASAKIILLEGGARVLQAMPEALSQRAKEQLEKLGVDVRLGARVTAIDSDGLKVESPASASTSIANSYQINSKCIVWAAGVAASPLGRHLADSTGASTDRAGRVVVEPDLTLPGHPEISVIGDLAAAKSHAPRPRAHVRARRVARRQADGPRHGGQHPAPPGGPAHAAVSLPRLRQPGHHRPQLCRGGPHLARRAGAVLRLFCVAVLAVCARVLPDRLSQPAGGAAGLGLGVLELCALCAGGDGH